jgi:hypothetical protein
MCECGCGTELRANYRGHFYAFARGHRITKRKPIEELQRTHICNGYVMERAPGHPHANRDGFVGQHILVAEKALGYYLPDGAEVHHWNLNRSNNANSNLLVCPSKAYHLLIHRRMEARAACGNPNFRKCYICKKWDDESALYIRARTAYHTECHRIYQAQRKAIAA